MARLLCSEPPWLSCHLPLSDRGPLGEVLAAVSETPDQHGFSLRASPGRDHDRDSLGERRPEWQGELEPRETLPPACG